MTRSTGHYWEFPGMVPTLLIKVYLSGLGIGHNCERVTSAICHVAKVHLDTKMVAYIDMGAGTPDDLVVATYQFNLVCQMIRDLGLDLALSKCEGPCHRLTWTGSTFDSIKMLMYIEEDKVEDCLDLALSMLTRSDITLKEMESFIGKLQHSIKFCPGGRRFLYRLLRMRREMNEIDKYSLTYEARIDVLWFVRFLKQFNGVAVIRSQVVFTDTFMVDACLIGGGGLWKGKAHALFKWPTSVLSWNLAINHLEMFNVLVLFRLWCSQLRGTTVLVYCDNQTSVKSLFKGKARSEFMASCLRELWHISCANDIFVSCKHIKGEENTAADILSRAFNSPKDWQRYEDFRSEDKSVRSEVGRSLFDYPDSFLR